MHDMAIWQSVLFKPWSNQHHKLLMWYNRPAIQVSSVGCNNALHFTPVDVFQHPILKSDFLQFLQKVQVLLCLDSGCVLGLGTVVHDMHEEFEAVDFPQPLHWCIQDLGMFSLTVWSPPQSPWFCHCLLQDKAAGGVWGCCGAGPGGTGTLSLYVVSSLLDIRPITVASPMNLMMVFVTLVSWQSWVKRAYRGGLNTHPCGMPEMHSCLPDLPQCSVLI